MILPVALISAIFYISAALESEKAFHLSEDSNNQTKIGEVRTGEAPTTPLPNHSFPDPCPLRRNRVKNRFRERSIIDLREIHIPGTDPFEVACGSFPSYGSRWMRVYNKRDSSKIFNRTYEDYERGFGNVGTDLWDEFFIGLKQLQLLMSGNPHEVMVDTNAFNRKICNHFVVGPRNEGYMLKSIGNCTGNDNGLMPRQGSKFSTFDRDEDGVPDRNLGEEVGFGWWFDPSMNNIRDDYDFIRMYIRRID